MIANPLLALWITTSAHASCDAADLDVALADAERAFVAADPRALEAAVRQARRALGCQGDPVTTATSARVHRALALGAWLRDDRPGSELHFRAMLRADPLTALPTELAPADHPVRLALVAAEEASLALVEGPGSGWLLVDGLRTGAVPVGQPYVLQRVAPDGGASRPKLVDAAPVGRGRSSRGAARWAGVGLGAVGAGLYAVAWTQHASYQAAVAAQDDARIGRAHFATNALSAGSVASAALGGGLVVCSFALP